MAADVQQTPFVKQLAASGNRRAPLSNPSVTKESFLSFQNLILGICTDRPTREKALDSLESYLTSSRSFSDIELLKIWKGLFFCELFPFFLARYDGFLYSSSRCILTD